MRLLIAGAGGFGAEVADWLAHGPTTPFDGFLDDEKLGHGTINVIDTIRNYKPINLDKVIVAIGDPTGRSKVVKMLQERGVRFASMGFTGYVVAPSAKVGDGSILCPYSLVSAKARVGAFVHVNVFSSVGHHVTVGDFCTLSSHCDLMANVVVGERVFFGSGARVLPGVTIGDDAVIGAGSVVGRDVPEGATVFANFARTL